MYTLNLLATYMGGIYTRNDLATRYLDDYKETLNQKNELLQKMELTSKYVLDLSLPSGSYWLNKANMFSLFTVLNSRDIKDAPSNIKERLLTFEKSLPEEYKISAKEGVNNRKERLIREKYLSEILFK